MWRIRVKHSDPGSTYAMRDSEGEVEYYLTRKWKTFETLPDVVERKPWFFEVEELKKVIKPETIPEPEPEKEPEPGIKLIEIETEPVEAKSEPEPEPESELIEPEPEPEKPKVKAKLPSGKKKKRKRQTMAYSTQANLESYKDEDILKIIAGAGGVITAALVTAAIAWADGEIDFYIGNRYSVPLTSPPQVITNMSVQLAICRLYRRSSASNQDAENECKRVYDQLEKIRDGEAQLPGTTTSSDDVAIIHPFTDDDKGDYDEPLHHMGNMEYSTSEDDE